MLQRADQVEYAMHFVGAWSSEGHIMLRDEFYFQAARWERIATFGWSVTWLANEKFIIQGILPLNQ